MNMHWPSEAKYFMSIISTVYSCFLSLFIWKFLQTNRLPSLLHTRWHMPRDLTFQSFRFKAKKKTFSFRCYGEFVYHPQTGKTFLFARIERNFLNWIYGLIEATSTSQSSKLFFWSRVKHSVLSELTRKIHQFKCKNWKQTLPKNLILLHPIGLKTQ